MASGVMSHLLPSSAQVLFSVNPASRQTNDPFSFLEFKIFFIDFHCFITGFAYALEITIYCLKPPGIYSKFNDLMILFIISTIELCKFLLGFSRHQRELLVHFSRIFMDGFIEGIGEK